MKISNCTLLLLFSFVVGCNRTESNDIDRNLSKGNITEKINVADENVVVEKAKVYAEIYLEDPKSFFEAAADIMGNDIRAVFHHESNQWRVFYTDGINHLHVRLDASLKRGNVKLNNGRFVGAPKRQENKLSQEDILVSPLLFSPADFKREVDNESQWDGK